MACWNKRRWYIESKSGMSVLCRDTTRGFAWRNKIHVVVPAIFRSVVKAQKHAKIHDGIVKHFDSKEYEKSVGIPF